ncbi:hypothetical protein ACLOJK_008001 [Asimina triloba]
MFSRGSHIVIAQHKGGGVDLLSSKEKAFLTLPARSEWENPYIQVPSAEHDCIGHRLGAEELGRVGPCSWGCLTCEVDVLIGIKGSTRQEVLEGKGE